jgi:hypothetical protein
MCLAVDEPLTLVDESHHHVGLSERYVGGQLVKETRLGGQPSRGPRNDVENDEADLEIPLIDGRHGAHGGPQIRLPVRLSAVRVICREAKSYRAEIGRLGLPGPTGAEQDGDENSGPYERHPSEHRHSMRELRVIGMGRTRWIHALPPFLPAACSPHEGVEVRAYEMPDVDSMRTVEF